MKFCGKVYKKIWELFYSWNVLVRLPKDKPKDLKEDHHNLALVNGRGIDASFDEELNKFVKGSFGILSEKNHVCAARRPHCRRVTYDPSVGVS